MYEIYINETKLFLASSEKLLRKEIASDNMLIARYTGKPKFLLNYVDMMEKGTKLKAVYIHHTDKRKLIDDFKSNFKVVGAGGGLVVNENKEILFIYRRGFWDLPKGKIEPNEKKKEAAIREVEEETGINNLSIIDKLLVTRHTYKSKQKNRLIKKTYWYLMSAIKQDLIPQKEEDITDACWLTYESFKSEERKVFKNILEVMEANQMRQ